MPYELLAREFDLETADTQMYVVNDFRACLITRYDRIARSPVQRLHQEDLCQALGVSHKLKYERDQGPTFAHVYACTEAVSQHLPEDLERLVKWLIFNVIVGNCDAHAKNLSYLRGANGDWRLTPHYDLVSTRVYERVSKNLAMTIGGAEDSGTVTGTHWRRLAAEIKFGSALLLKFVRAMAESAPEKYRVVSAKFADQYGDSPIVQPIAKVIQVQSRAQILTAKPNQI